MKPRTRRTAGRANSDLRRRLLRFGLAIVAVCGLLFGAFWLMVRFQIVPILTEHLRTKASVTVQVLDHELAVPIAAGDLAAVRRRLQGLRPDPDFAFVQVRDAGGDVLAGVGPAPRARAFRGPPRVARLTPDGFVAHSEIDLEGLRMGTIAVGFATRRVDRIVHALGLFGLVGIFLVTFATLFAFRYADAFVAPIHDVIGLSKRIAAGELGSRLAGHPPGELGQLVQALNSMAEALEARTLEIEQKRSELAASLEALGKAQSRLVDASRMAGMAEVATGVLHNVGNVLNSVNVSAQLLEDTLSTSKSALLPRAVGLVTEHRANLAAFFTNDPRGQKLPAFLEALCTQLDEERRHQLGEVAGLRRNIEHIKAVVSEQQTFARSRGVSEVIAVADVIETALGIEKASFENREIRVVRELGDLPVVNVDRNKLIQILINLLSNARHALMDAGDVHDRVVTVRTRRIAEDRVEIGVSDNGVGIPAANLTRIFEHGFTTKKDGHGFGLHSSAIAAKEMGGSLRAESHGPGRGATFTLELPLALAEAA